MIQMAPALGIGHWGEGHEALLIGFWPGSSPKVVGDIDESEMIDGIKKAILWWEKGSSIFLRGSQILEHIAISSLKTQAWV